MNVRALGGIRTRDPNNQAAEDPRLRPLSHRNRLVRYQLNNNISLWGRVLFESYEGNIPCKPIYALYYNESKGTFITIFKETFTCLYFKPQFWVQSSRSILRTILILSLYLRLLITGNSINYQWNN